MHEHEELYSMWGPDIPHVDPSTALRHFIIAISGFVTFGLLCNYALVPERPAIPRQYPFDGLVKESGGLEANKVGFSPSAFLRVLAYATPYHYRRSFPSRFRLTQKA